MISGLVWSKAMVDLPSFNKSCSVTLYDAICKRRSKRTYVGGALTLSELSQILWSATMAPSAGAIRPLHIYIVAGAHSVEGLTDGIYAYVRRGGCLELIRNGDMRVELGAAALSQGSIVDAPISLIINATIEDMIARYGRRGYRYLYMEAGHVAQNIALCATGLGLGCVTIGAFNDKSVQTVLGIKGDILYIIPVGRL